MVPLSKAKLKLFRSLAQKKFRYREGLFMAAGRKMLAEALKSDWRVEWVVALEGTELPEIGPGKALCTDIATLRELSGQGNPEGVLTVIGIPQNGPFLQVNGAAEMPEVEGPAFLLEGIQDPGNLGTLIRTADWMGFRTVVCASGTVDVFNLKVLRSSMGSVFRLKVIYVHDFVEWVSSVAESVWVADMEGASVVETRLPDRDFILLGNEANGVGAAIRELTGIGKINIPLRGGAESLNVAAAGAVLAWEMVRGVQ